jgi:hypothetical protein
MQFIVLPSMVSTKDKDCVLCVAQAEAKETAGHENVTSVINYNASHIKHLIGYKIPIMMNCTSVSLFVS